MIIDGHAHACGCYNNTKSTIEYLKNNKIDKVILCPGEPNSLKNYSFPMFSNIIHSSNMGYYFNKLIKFIIGIKGLEKHIDEQNLIVGDMARLYPNEILQAYWVNPLEDECIDKLDKNLEIYNFKMLKLHQCWNNFDISSINFIKIVEWATKNNMPVFIHLLSREQSLKLAKIADNYPDTIFIIAHMIGFEDIVDNSSSNNVYFDISAPQLISRKRVKNAIAKVGCSRLILGSDSPYGKDNIKRNLDMLRQFSLSDEDIDKISGQNIIDILNNK